MAPSAPWDRAPEPRCWAQWHAAAARPEIDQELRAFYADLDRAVAGGDAVCQASGQCCKFEQFGHRLYVTALEVAWFLKQVAAAPPGPPDAPEGGGYRLPQFAETCGACPYQISGRCSTHLIRPLGCRVFFCQAGTEAWQHQLYEQFTAQLRELHERHAIEYCYLDWIAGLSAASPSRLE